MDSAWNLFIGTLRTKSKPFHFSRAWEKSRYCLGKQLQVLRRFAPWVGLGKKIIIIIIFKMAFKPLVTKSGEVGWVFLLCVSMVFGSRCFEQRGKRVAGKISAFGDVRGFLWWWLGESRHPGLIWGKVEEDEEGEVSGHA